MTAARVVRDAFVRTDEAANGKLSLQRSFDCATASRGEAVTPLKDDKIIARYVTIKCHNQE
jgi:hypothetical protein